MVRFLFILDIYDCKFSDCGKVFTDRHLFKKHLAMHNEKQFICNYPSCGKKFSDNSKLKRHCLVHTVIDFLYRERSLINVTTVEGAFPLTLT
jgi:uncharacterized Zn-finger protein